MSLLYIVAALCVLAPAALVPVVALGPSRALRRGRTAGRLRLAVGGLVTALGPIATAMVVVLFCSAAVIAVLWPLGEVLASFENAVDWPVQRYVGAHRDPQFAEVNLAYTYLGDRDPLKVVSVVAAIAFAVLWRRRWWIPVVAMLGQFAVEQYVQQILTVMVDRGHPPTGLGSYPSGGVARIVLTFGTLAALAALTWRLSTRVRVFMATVVAVAATVEAYTRIYVQKHWLTDVVAGLVFGPMLLAGFQAAVYVLAGRFAGGSLGSFPDGSRGQPPVDHTPQASEQGPTGGYRPTPPPRRAQAAAPVPR